MWTEECDKAFQELKRYIGRSFLFVTSHFKLTTKFGINKIKDKVQKPIYYVSHALLDVDIKYPATEKMTLTLVVVLINQHLRQIMQ